MVKSKPPNRPPNLRGRTGERSLGSRVDNHFEVSKTINSEVLQHRLHRTGDRPVASISNWLLNSDAINNEVLFEIK